MYKSQAIFIDFDILVNADGELDYDQLKILQNITEITNAPLILTSQWLYYFDPTLRPVSRSGYALKCALEDNSIPYWGITEDFSTDNLKRDHNTWQVRGIEITEYLRFHRYITNWCYIGWHPALDDFVHNRQVCTPKLTSDIILSVVLILGERATYEQNFLY